MKLSIDILSDELPTAFQKYIEQKLLRVLPKEKSERILLTATIEKHKSKFQMKCNMRGALSYSIMARNYNPYLLINSICEKLDMMIQKDLKRKWREDFVRVGSDSTQGNAFAVPDAQGDTSSRNVHN